MLWFHLRANGTETIGIAAGGKAINKSLEYAMHTVAAVSLLLLSGRALHIYTGTAGIFVRHFEFLCRDGPQDFRLV